LVAIFIAHGTLGLSEKFVYGEIMKFEVEGRQRGRGSW